MSICIPIICCIISLYSSSGDNTVGVWDMNTGCKLMSYSGHHSDVHAIDYSRKLDLIVFNIIR